MLRRFAHPKRVEIGGQVAPDTVGTNDHQRADGVEHSAFDRLVTDLNTGSCSLRFDLVACGFGFRLCRPLSVKRCRQIIVGHRRPIGTRPRGASGLGFYVQISVAKLGEKVLPRRIDRVRVIGVLRIKLLKILGVVALHKAGCVELVVRGLVGHCWTSRGEM